MNKLGSGISNKKTAQVEKFERDQIIENFAKRIEKMGKVPGTHTLGFATREEI
mgnify:CR=1 FL=1